jgi:hypothetical protein
VSPDPWQDLSDCNEVARRLAPDRANSQAGENCVAYSIFGGGFLFLELTKRECTRMPRRFNRRLPGPDPPAAEKSLGTALRSLCARIGNRYAKSHGTAVFCVRRYADPPAIDAPLLRQRMSAERISPSTLASGLAPSGCAIAYLARCS